MPFGAQLRYFVRSQQPPGAVLACLLFSIAAWKMAPRDAYIGWSQTARQANLPSVVNHSRFLILPWVRVPNLASHILSLAARQMPPGLVGRLSRPAGAIGNAGGSNALPRGLLSRG